MPNRDYNYRQFKRYVKGIKRIREDRAEHGDDHSCDCFCPDTQKGRGKTFSRFAGTPAFCSCWMCSWQGQEDHRFVPTE